MPKLLHSWSTIESVSFLKLVFLGFLFSVLIAGCNNHPGPVSDEPDIDTTGKINWLDTLDQPGWNAVAFSSNASDSDNIKREKQIIRAYVRGSLAEYNAINTAENPGAPQYRVEGFKFARKNQSPLQFTVWAFLIPPVSKSHHDGVGTHIQPPPPPPPQ